MNDFPQEEIGPAAGDGALYMEYLCSGAFSCPSSFRASLQLVLEQPALGFFPCKNTR